MKRMNIEYSTNLYDYNQDDSKTYTLQDTISGANEVRYFAITIIIKHEETT